jgi:hypothetical protein
MVVNKWWKVLICVTIRIILIACLNLYTNIYCNSLANIIEELVRAECMYRPWLLADTKVATILGIFKTPEGVVERFKNFAWAPKKKKNPVNFSLTPPPPWSPGGNF